MDEGEAWMEIRNLESREIQTSFQMAENPIKIQLLIQLVGRHLLIKNIIIIIIIKTGLRETMCNASNFQNAAPNCKCIWNRKTATFIS